jgi:hypothetical protein
LEDEAMGMKSLALVLTLCFSAVALTGGGAEARPYGGRGGAGHARAFIARPHATPRFVPHRFTAPRAMVRHYAPPRYSAPRFAGPRFVAPSRAAPRFAPAVRAAGVYPRFLGHARRHFWRGRWLWVGVPLAAYAYDPCWTRVWTDWGWGWFYACGYDPAYGY